ncbi:MAG: hypothetical protein ACT4QF_21625 [Sporichthyaceae bacterium]
MTEVRGYADRRPIAVPDSWAALRGPASGPVVLPEELSWTGRNDYDLDDPADARVFYERVLVDAVTVEVIDRVVNGERLRALWPQLFLPRGVRAAWEARFPDLTSVG